MNRTRQTILYVLLPGIRMIKIGLTIQNKFRYQVLMRLSDTSVLPDIYEAAAISRTRDVLVSVEENPTNLS